MAAASWESPPMQCSKVSPLIIHRLRLSTAFACVATRAGAKAMAPRPVRNSPRLSILRITLPRLLWPEEDEPPSLLPKHPFPRLGAHRTHDHNAYAPLLPWSRVGCSIGLVRPPHRRSAARPPPF